ncbi:MAG: hypothetical protein J6B95_05985 [Oscillospiraceae bacterium]|nr:hypothetical protein [Oscillospiraceae bacterium]
MIVYRELSSLERDLVISAKTLYAVSNNMQAKCKYHGTTQKAAALVSNGRSVHIFAGSNDKEN